MSLAVDTVFGLRLAGVDPAFLAARRRRLLDDAAAGYVLADRHVASAEPFVDDQLERSHVRLQHDHPVFFAAGHPIPEATSCAR